MLHPTCILAVLRAAVVALGLALVTAGCGKSNGDVIKENRAAFEAKRAELVSIFDALPQPGAPATPAAKLDPPLTYDKKGETGNFDILAAEQLRDPDAEPALDLLLSSALLRCLQWTGPKNPMAASALGNNGESMAREMKHALGLRYLGVVRVTKFEKPVVSGERFTGGNLAADVFVVDLPSKKVVASGSFAVQPSDTVQFQYKKGEDPDEAAKRFIKSTVWVAARAQVKVLIEASTGATLTFD